jgi:hypothetical protein
MTILHQHGLQIGVEYHVVELIAVTNEVYQWCESQFGPAGKRWFSRSPKIYFTNKLDHMMFLVRWS